MKVFSLKLIFFMFLVFTFFSCRSKSEEKLIRIVFYRVSNDVVKNVEESLKGQILSNDDEKILLEFEKIDDINKLKERIEKDKNVSLVFSNTIHLPFKNITPFDTSLYETFPSCVKRYSFDGLEKNNEGVASLPILLNTYHFFFNNLIVKKQDESNFYYVDSFSNMLKSLSNRVKYPILCAGGDDETLLFFVATVMQMVGDAYSKENKKINNLKDRGKVFNSALELIVEWQKNGFFHPEWFRLKHSDISMFMDLKEIGVLFAPMNEYQKNGIKQFYSLIPYMPVSKDSSYSGLPISILSIIQPTQNEENISTLKSSYISKIVEYCISIEGQNELSTKTGFIPSSMSNMNQSAASSVRYTLATVPVVLEDAGSILLEDSGDSTLLLKEIRNYLQANGLGY